MIILYGIKNCDSCQKAKKWLISNKIEFKYHDFRNHGLTHKILRLWLTIIDWELFLNKRSTTWRELPEDYKNLIDGKTCIDYFIKQPTLIKRPIIKDGQSIIIGYKPDVYQLKLNP